MGWQSIQMETPESSESVGPEPRRELESERRVDSGRSAGAGRTSLSHWWGEWSNPHLWIIKKERKLLDNGKVKNWPSERRGAVEEIGKERISIHLATCYMPGALMLPSVFNQREAGTGSCFSFPEWRKQKTHSSQHNRHREPWSQDASPGLALHSSHCKHCPTAKVSFYVFPKASSDTLQVCKLFHDPCITWKINHQ